MSQIELKNVNKTYGKDNCVIDHLDLTISDGSFTVMVGPSGCGKTIAIFRSPGSTSFILAPSI